MNALKYYKDTFGPELIRIQSSITATIKDRISIVSLLPSDNHPGGFGEQAEAFNETPSKRLFLFCYFFSALIDQAIHSGLRSEHPHFDKIARYPKIAGLLATYLSNLHPAILLLAATLYIPKKEEENAIAEFNQLADFFAEDYCNFLENEYPRITGRLQSRKERKNACVIILAEISNALPLLAIPQSLRPYSELQCNKNLYENLVLYFSSKIDNKLQEMANVRG